jgi:hypothetical protein
MASTMCTASRGRRRWAIRVSFCKRKNKNKKWPKRASGCLRTGSFAGTIFTYFRSYRRWMIPNGEKRFCILNALTHGSAVSWQHVNLWESTTFRRSACRIRSVLNPGSVNKCCETFCESFGTLLAFIQDQIFVGRCHRSRAALTVNSARGPSCVAG